jgi:hypothetical protein
MVWAMGNVTRAGAASSGATARRRGVARGRKTSLAVRALALVFALALAALAARLWIGSAPRETRASAADVASDSDDGAANEPPLHGDHSAKDQEALRDILRDAEGKTP